MTKRSESPQAKRVKTPPKDSEEDIQRRVQEWRDAAEADRRLAESWKPPEITEEGQQQAEEALRRGEQWKKWFDTDQDELWRIAREKEEKQRADDMKAKASEWRSSIVKGIETGETDQSSGGEAQSSGGAVPSSESAKRIINQRGPLSDREITKALESKPWFTRHEESEPQVSRREVK